MSETLRKYPKSYIPPEMMACSWVPDFSGIWVTFWKAPHGPHPWYLSLCIFLAKPHVRPKCWQRSNGVILIIACSEVPFSVSVCNEGSQLPGGLSALRFQCKGTCRGWVLAVGALAAATPALGALPWELSVSSGAAGAGGWGYAPLPPGSPARQRLSSGGRFSLVPKAPRVSALLCRAVIFTGCGTCRKDSGRQRKT